LVVTFFFYHPSIHSTDFMIFLGRFFIQLFNFHSLNPACCLIKKHVEIERKRNGYHPWNQDLDISPPLFYFSIGIGSVVASTYMSATFTRFHWDRPGSQS
jgi:hypothetical protein